MALKHLDIVGKRSLSVKLNVKQQIEEVVFDFMDQDLDELILDNASRQDGLRGWIVENGYQSPSFVSVRRNHPHGIPEQPGLLVARCSGFLDVSKFSRRRLSKNNSRSLQLNEDCRRTWCEAVTSLVG